MESSICVTSFGSSCASLQRISKYFRTGFRHDLWTSPSCAAFESAPLSCLTSTSRAKKRLDALARGAQNGQIGVGPAQRPLFEEPPGLFQPRNATQRALTPPGLGRPRSGSRSGGPFKVHLLGHNNLLSYMIDHKSHRCRISYIHIVYYIRTHWFLFPSCRGASRSSTTLSCVFAESQSDVPHVIR